MRTRLILAGTLGVLVVLAVLGSGWYLLGRMSPKVCPFSGRIIHPQTRAFVTIGGKEYETCCVRCAIIEARQTGKPLRVLRAADFETGKLIDPARAWYVESSDVNLCMRMEPAAESPGRESVYVRAFDRCSPSVLAFSSEQQTRDFIVQHGGTLVRLNDLLREATPISPKVQRP